MNRSFILEVGSVSASRSIFQIPRAPAGFCWRKKRECFLHSYYIWTQAIKHQTHQTSKNKIPKVVLVDLWLHQIVGSDQCFSFKHPKITPLISKSLPPNLPQATPTNFLHLNDTNQRINQPTQPNPNIPKAPISNLTKFPTSPHLPRKNPPGIFPTLEVLAVAITSRLVEAAIDQSILPCSPQQSTTRQSDTGESAKGVSGESPMNFDLMNFQARWTRNRKPLYTVFFVVFFGGKILELAGDSVVFFPKYFRELLQIGTKACSWKVGKLEIIWDI